MIRMMHIDSRYIYADQLKEFIVPNSKEGLTHNPMKVPTYSQAQYIRIYGGCRWCITRLTPTIWHHPQNAHICEHAESNDIRKAMQ